MPPKTKKQAKFMQAVANNPEFADKVGVKQSIGREFTKEKSMNTKRMNRLEELGRVDNEKAYTKKGKRNLKDEKERVVGELKMNKGGGVSMTSMMKDKEGRALAKNKKKMTKSQMADAAGRMMGKPVGAPKKAKGKKMMGGGKVKAYKKGGSVGSASKRADGIAQRGHTRGRMV